MTSVTVWQVDLDPGRKVVEALRALLDDRERAAAHARADVAGDRYVVAHGAAREILGATLGEPPQAITFGEPGPRGRPTLRSRASLSFNLSHSGSLALVAVTEGATVGVDVEAYTRRPTERLAHRSLSSVELADWTSLPDVDRDRAFFRHWTRKEALLKAQGRGIARLRELTATPAPAGWTIEDLQVPGAAAAVAVHVARASVSLREWVLRSR